MSFFFLVRVATFLTWIEFVSSFVSFKIATMDPLVVPV